MAQQSEREDPEARQAPADLNGPSAAANHQPAREVPGLFVPPGHFYSPHVDAEDPAVAAAMEAEAHPTAALTRFGIDEREVLEWFERIAQHYYGGRGRAGRDQGGADGALPFPREAAAGKRYYYDNPAFPLADALALLAFLTTARPRRYVEIGAGHSSCAALDINEQYLGGAVEMTFIDPHPETFFELLGAFPQDRALLLPARLQDVPLEKFAALEANDMLFIDSSHVAKTGSDVVDYMFRILPALRSGVWIHIHDIFFPFEYPRAWIAEQNRSWNEAYLLRAFLHGNPRFRVVYLSDWIFKCKRALLEARMPLCIPHRGGSLWMLTV